MVFNGFMVLVSENFSSGFSGNYREFSPQQVVGIIEIAGAKREKCVYNRAFAWRTPMRITVLLVSLMMLSGCTALMVGGGSSGAYEHRKDERSASVVTSDTAITSKIKGKYAADPVVSVFDIGVRTYKGTVTLTGKVGSYTARNQAHALAKGTGGVVAVNNQVVIEDRSQ
jgi:hypothetical protein